MIRQRDKYPFPSVPAPIRYTAALGSVAVVFVLYRASESMIDGGGLFLLLGIAVIGCAWFAGTGTALAATVLGVVLGRSGRADTVAGGRDAPGALHRAGSAAHGAGQRDAPGAEERGA